MNAAELDWQLRQVLRRYTVRQHTLATAEHRAAVLVETGGWRRGSRYAVWREGVLVSEPTGHAEAHAERERLIIADLTPLIRAAGEGAA